MTKAQGPMERWVIAEALLVDLLVGQVARTYGENAIIDKAREQDAKLAQAEAERDKYKAESRSLNRERAAEVARAETAEAERDALREALAALAGTYEEEQAYMEAHGLDTSDETAIREPNAWAGIIARDVLQRLTPAAPDGGDDAAVS